MALKVVLTWTFTPSAAAPADGFNIAKAVSGETITFLDTVGPDVRTYEDANVVEGTSYFYAVESFNLSGHSQEVRIALRVTMPAPPRVDTLTGEVQEV